MINHTKICILHLIPTLEGGGAERQLSMLAIEHVKYGYNVHVCARRGGTYLEALQNHGVTVHWMGEYRGNFNVFLWLKIRKLINRIKPNIVQTWLAQMDIIGGSAALWSSVPWIVSERSSQGAFGGDTLTSRFLVRRAHAIVANSMGGTQYWFKRLGNGFPIFKIGNAIDVEAVRNSVSCIFRESSFNNKKLVLVVGRFNVEKAHEIVVKAIQKLPESCPIHVFMIGEGSLQPAIKEMVNIAGLCHRFSFFPFRFDWWGLLKEACVLISVSRFEGHPNVVLEAIAGGCPLIVSDIPAHREFLREETATFVPLDDPIALSNAVASVVSEPGLAQQRAKRAMAVVDELRITAAADAYTALYKRVISGVAE